MQLFDWPVVCGAGPVRSFILDVLVLAVSSRHFLFCFKPLTPFLAETSHFHICGLSLSLMLVHFSISYCPAAFPSHASYLLFSGLSGLSISPHPTPPLSPSRVHSLTPLISLSPLPAVSTLYSCLSYSHTYLPPLSFILSASSHHACGLSNSLRSRRNCLHRLDHL